MSDDATTPDEGVTFADLGLDRRGARGAWPTSATRPRRRSRPRPSRRCWPAATSSASRRPAPARPRRSRCRSCPGSTCRRRRRRRWCSRRPASSRSRCARPSRSTPPHLPGRARAAGLRRPGLRRPAVARCAAACTSSSARPAGSWTTSRRAPSTSPSCASWCSTRPTRCSTWASPRTSRRSSPTPRTTSRSRCSPRPCRRRSGGISKKYLHDPVEITVKNKTATAANITQRYLLVSYPQKVDALTRILEVENFEGMIVFVRTKNETETLAEKLRARGFSADRDQRRRRAGPARAHRQPAASPASSTSWSPPTSPPAGSTSSGSATSSTTTSPPTPSPTCTASAAPAAPGAAATRSRSSPRASATCSSTSRRPPASRSPRCSCRRVDDVNATRLARFDDAITEALSAQTERIDFFRDVVAHYVREHDVPEVDVAAALAVVAAGRRRRCCSTPSAERPPAARRPPGPQRPPDRGGAARAWRPRPARPRRRPPLATYRIAVGKRHKVEPRQIVGAHRQRGRAEPPGLRAHRHPAGLLAGRAAGRPARRDLGRAARAPASPAS